MKKICAAAIAALIVLAGCKGKTAPEQPAVAQEEPSAASEPQVAMIKSVMIAGGYWKLAAEGADAGKMKWVEYAVPGTQVQAYGNPDPADSSSIVEIKRQVVRTTDNEKRDFIHILYDGNDYWAQDYSIAVNAAPGVVMEGSAYVFTKPSPDAMGDQKFDIGTVVGVLNAKADTGSFPYAANYVKVNAYVNSRLIEGAYLSKDVVSTTPRDLLAMQIYEKLSARNAQGDFTLTDSVARNDLLTTAMSFDLPEAVKNLFYALTTEEEQEAAAQDNWEDTL